MNIEEESERIDRTYDAMLEDGMPAEFVETIEAAREAAHSALRDFLLGGAIAPRSRPAEIFDSRSDPIRRIF
jgi:hypothetical protein